MQLKVTFSFHGPGYAQATVSLVEQAGQDYAPCTLSTELATFAAMDLRSAMAYVETVAIEQGYKTKSVPWYKDGALWITAMKDEG